MDRPEEAMNRGASVPFSRAAVVGNELDAIGDAIRGGQLSGDRRFSRLCEDWFRERLQCSSALLTSSCTHALEIAAILLDLAPGDEVIMPSFTFPSTANAFVLHGAKIVFVDIRADTMNVDETQIEAAITPRTRAIVVVHYGGLACDMDAILEIGIRHDLKIIEDAAHAFPSTWRGDPLGSLGDIGAFSFHETKNLTSGGEGGMICLRDPDFVNRAEVIRDKGTNRRSFFRGEVAKYSWVDVGSSYLMNEISAAYLWAQVMSADQITARRLEICQAYRTAFADLAKKNRIELQAQPPDRCHVSGHLFYLKLLDLEDRQNFLSFLSEHNVNATFHYVPLHTSPAGLRFGRFNGEDRVTTRDSARLVRLPVFFNMTAGQLERTINVVHDYFARTP